MKKNKFGFTLTEMLVALVIIGILGMVLAPIITRMMPSQNKVLIKRSYYLITNTVVKMLDDESLYSPFGAVGSADETTPIYASSLFSNKDSVNFNGKTYSGDTKFFGIFSEIIGAKDGGTETFKTIFRRGTGSVIIPSGTVNVATTKDGIKWRFYLPGAVYPDIASVITIDVNGDRAPNCFQGDKGACPSRVKDFDQYVIIVYNNGVVFLSLNDEWVKSILDASSSVGLE